MILIILESDAYMFIISTLYLDKDKNWDKCFLTITYLIRLP